MKYCIISVSWVQKVKPKLVIPQGLFTKSADAIASYLCKHSDSLKQAMSRLNFYINRGAWKDPKFDVAKDKIRKYFS